MEWVLRSPQIHSTFSNLGHVQADGYHVSENCNVALKSILHNILTEDKLLRTYRRSISFGQNIEKDLIPLLIHAKEDDTIELLTRIFVNLTIPIECLLSVEIISKSDFGRHTIIEINNLLTSTKNAFADNRATRVIIDFLKKNVDTEQKMKLLPAQCTNISNGLLLIRNILHIPEDNKAQPPVFSGSSHIVQNQIIWNIFSNSIDKVLLKLMKVPDAFRWGVTMVQIIALLYKDQHAVTLHKLLDLWIQSSFSETSSSEDNESNTTPPKRSNGDSSLMLTSAEPTSDSSDAGAVAKNNEDQSPNTDNQEWESSINQNAAIPMNVDSPPVPSEIHTNNMEERQDIENDDDCMKHDTTASCSSGIQSEPSNISEGQNFIAEISDCGYGTQNMASMTTSSNEDEVAHQKPHNPKQKPRAGNCLQDRKRKKVTKKGKSNVSNVQGLTNKTPTDDDISNLLKQFTVEFLLKGYNPLVQLLHNEILTNLQLEIDTSHFFWLVTYFLKFATQMQLSLRYVHSVLSYDLVSYLTAEGVNLCEKNALSIKLGGQDLMPNVRRLHLVVTAIREFVQAINAYKMLPHLTDDDKDSLSRLEIKMCETEELRSLMVLLLRHYTPKYYNKQYLQDLIVTNHILLMFLDDIMKLPEYTCSANMVDHIRQFASPEIIYQYGSLLEDYCVNGEFVNDCIFTIMHHVGNELGNLDTLFQPNILKTFLAIWKSDYEICDDWSDLIEYVVNTFMKNPHSMQNLTNFCEKTQSLDNDDILTHLIGTAPARSQDLDDTETKKDNTNSTPITPVAASKERWTEDEASILNWKYAQCNTLPDAIGQTIELLQEDGIDKSRNAVIKELFEQNIISSETFEKLMKGESDNHLRKNKANNEMRDAEIAKLCEELAQNDKSNFLDWVQKVLLEIGYVKIYLEKMKSDESVFDESKMMNYEAFRKKADKMPALSPVIYHAVLLNQSIPLVPWNCPQANICKDLKFLQLLHKLGFNMPVDSGKVFIRIPHYWTADFVYQVAGKISPIDTSKLKFSFDEFSERSATEPELPKQEGVVFSENNEDVTKTEPANVYQVHKEKHLATMINFTPTPGCSYNNEYSEMDKSNWLKVVQRSQELKISLKERVKVICAEDVSMSALSSLKKTDAAFSSSAESVAVSASPVIMLSEPIVCPPLMMAPPPRCLTSFVTGKPELDYSMGHLDDEINCNDSVCETASVASDLTRMYVSDEDDDTLPTDDVDLTSTALVLYDAVADVKPNANTYADVDTNTKVDVNASISVETDTDADTDERPGLSPSKRPRLAIATNL